VGNITAISVIITLVLSFETVTQLSAAQMTSDEWCGGICDEQDEFLGIVDEEIEFDDERKVEEQRENGIDIDEGTGAPVAANARLSTDDIQFKGMLLNQTFTRVLNTNEIPDIEEVEEEIDTDATAERQIITFDFNEDNSNDDIRIYTTNNETVANLATTIVKNMNRTSIELFDNGRMIIAYSNEPRFDEAYDTRIYAPHNYTAVNGFRYTNNTIFDSAGNEILNQAGPSQS
jgi:hypothetical protein